MTTTDISHAAHGPAPRTLFDILSEEEDAEVWSDLLDDFLGPENDVYDRLLNQKAELSS